MKKKLKTAFVIFAIATIISLNMIVTFQSDSQEIYLSSITKAFADGESGVYYSCFTGKIASHGDPVRWCGLCNLTNVVKTGYGGCRLY